MLKTKSGLGLLVLISLFLFSCEKTEENKTESNTPKLIVESTKNKVEKIKNNLPIDVSKLVNKNSSQLDKTLGNPLEVKATEDGGEYRLYSIENEPKGLAVRLYKNQAKSFNLLLTNPIASSKETLKRAFGIDVGKQSPIKDPKEPLSERFEGTFNGVKFSKLSAKKDDKGKGFIFVLAEVEK